MNLQHLRCFLAVADELHVGRAARRRRLGLAELAGEPFAIVSRAVSSDYHERILALRADTPSPGVPT